MTVEGVDPLAIAMDAEDVNAFALSNAFETLGRCFEVFPATSEGELDAAERILAAVHEGSEDEIAAAAAIGQPLDCGMAATLLRIYLEFWKRGGQDRALLLTTVVDVRALEPAGDDRDLLHRLFEATNELCMLGDIFDDETGATDGARAFRRLSGILERRGDAERAFGAAASALNLAGRSPAVAESADLVLRLLGPGGNPVVRTRVQMRKTLALLAEAEAGDEESTVRAFDAAESLVRFLDLTPGEREAVTAMILPPLAKIPAMQPIAGMLAAGAPGIEVTPELARLRILAKPAWDSDSDLAEISFDEIGNLAIAIENERRDVEPPPPTASKSHWSTWSFDYPAFGRAVPHGNSLASDPDLGDTRLTVAHETIHVLCMVGDLGRALSALRLALLEVEERLWTFNDPADAEFIRGEAAPLPAGDVGPLAQAEQALELSRKIQALEDAWAPWLEGVAIFGESTAADESDEAVTVVTQLLANLFPDEGLDVEAARRGTSIEDVARLRQDEADRDFREAGRQLGTGRLRTALGGQYAYKYLAGYLAVRAVVASWRRSIGEELTAQRAFRILLHVTRFGTIEAVPDLAAPAVDFRDMAIDRMAKWVRSLQDIDPDSLRLLAREGHKMETGTCWRGGVLVSLADEEADAVAATRPMVGQALGTLAGDAADLDRIPDAVLETRELMRIFAKALDNEHWSMEESYPDLLAAFLERPMILPLAKFRCPFWTIEPDGRLVYLLRTSDPLGGRAKHQLIATSLSEDEAASLEAERGRLREGRMTVYRVADVAPAVYEPDFRGGGINYLAFSYGDWLHVEGRGYFSGTARVPDSIKPRIENRIRRNTLLDLENTRTADGQAGARRTANWLAAGDEWALKGTAYYPRQLVDRIGQMADDVLDRDHHPDAGLAAERLLAMVVGSSAAPRLQREGLGVLRDIDPEHITKVIHALTDSALAPAASSFLDQHSAELTELLGSLFEAKDGLWDVHSTLEDR
jgi:hypothetical protein